MTFVVRAKVHKHLLATLLSLEGLMLIIFGLIYFFSIIFFNFPRFICGFMNADI